MAEPDFPLSIDRRRLLTSAAAVTVTGILPGVKLADAATADVLRRSARAGATSSPLTPKAEPANFCAATARRLLEIARRNEICREAETAFAFDCKGVARDEEAGRTRGVRAV